MSSSGYCSKCQTDYQSWKSHQALCGRTTISCEYPRLGADGKWDTVPLVRSDGSFHCLRCPKQLKKDQDIKVGIEQFFRRPPDSISLQAHTRKCRGNLPYTHLANLPSTSCQAELTGEVPHAQVQGNDFNPTAVAPEFDRQNGLSSRSLNDLTESHDTTPVAPLGLDLDLPVGGKPLSPCPVSPQSALSSLPRNRVHEGKSVSY